MSVRVWLILGCLCGAIASPPAVAKVRDWSDREGRFLIRGEMIAASEDAVVVRKPNDELIAVPLDAISDDDQAAVKTQRDVEAPDPASPETIEQLHTWTTRGGFEFKGRVLAFGERDVEFASQAGLVTVNGTAWNNLDGFRKLLAIKIVAEFDDPTVETEADLRRWMRQKQGRPSSFRVQGIRMKLADGKEVPVPFFLFSDRDLEILKPGWETWRDSHDDEAAQRQESFLLSVQADQYRREEREARQVRMMQLELLGAVAGVTTIWEVYLSPRPGTFGRPLSVMVSARDSLQAQQMASARYPGYVVGPTRAVSR